MARKRGFTLIEIAVVVLVIGILMAIAFPNYLAARENSRRQTCVANLKRIEEAKDLWATDQRKAATARPTQEDLLGDATNGYMKVWPECPQNGTYTIGDMMTRPTCSVSGHELP